jgi:hypothetical protein
MRTLFNNLIFITWKVFVLKWEKITFEQQDTDLLLVV